MVTRGVCGRNLSKKEVAFQFSAARWNRVFHQIVNGIEDPILNLIGELLDLLLGPAGEINFMHVKLRILQNLYILRSQEFRRRRFSSSARLLDEGNWPVVAWKCESNLGIVPPVKSRFSLFP